jgi:hypothetical protein
LTVNVKKPGVQNSEIVVDQNIDLKLALSPAFMNFDFDEWIIGVADQLDFGSSA